MGVCPGPGQATLQGRGQPQDRPHTAHGPWVGHACSKLSPVAFWKKKKLIPAETLASRPSRNPRVPPVAIRACTAFPVQTLLTPLTPGHPTRMSQALRREGKRGQTEMASKMIELEPRNRRGRKRVTKDVSWLLRHYSTSVEKRISVSGKNYICSFLSKLRLANQNKENNWQKQDEGAKQEAQHLVTRKRDLCQPAEKWKGKRERGKQMLLSGSLNEGWCQEGCKIFRMLLPTPTSFFHIPWSFWLEKRVKMDILLLVWEDSKAAASRGTLMGPSWKLRDSSGHRNTKCSPRPCVQAALVPHLLKMLWKLETLIKYFLWDK